MTEERLAQPDPFDEKNFKPTTVEEMEGPRKKDLEEKLRAQDVKRQRINERRDAPSAVATTNALNDPSAVRRRSKLMLPEPQVSDRELEEMAKMGGAAMMDVDADDDTPGGALVSRYGVPPASSSGAAAARAPQIGGHDAILQEAQNLRRLAEGQTPLLGGGKSTLAGSDFSGITPARRDAPNAEPVGGGDARELRRRDPVRGSPPRGNRFGRGDAASRFAQHQRPGRDAGAAGGTRGEGARDAREERTARKSRVASAPMSEYQVMIPDLPEDDDEGAGLAMEEDMGDVLAREAAARAEEEAAELRRRSAAIRRGTPRPTPESRGPVAAAAGGGDPTEAETLIAAELALVLEHDAAKYPAKKERRPRAVPHLPRVEERETAAAAALVAREAEAVRRAMGHADADDEEYARAAVAVRGDWIVHAETANPCRDARRNPRIAWRRRRRNLATSRGDGEGRQARRQTRTQGGTAHRRAAQTRRSARRAARGPRGEDRRGGGGTRGVRRAARAGTARRAETHGGAHGTDGEGERQRTRVAGDVQSPRGGARRRQKRRVKRANRNDATVRVPDVHVSPVAL